MNEYYCPKCGATLNYQSGFDPDSKYWTCTECGTTLFDDAVYSGDRYPDVLWFCDNCNALLNEQSGFSDDHSTWRCAECGHLNNISESEIRRSDSDKPNIFSAVGAVAGLAVVYATLQHNKPSKGDHPIRSLAVFILIIVLCLGGIGLLHYNTHKDETPLHPGEIQIGYSSSSLRKENYYDAVLKLSARGFSDIRIYPLEDLTTGWITKSGEVVSVEIDGQSDFSSGDWASKQAVVSITYHSFSRSMKDGFPETGIIFLSLDEYAFELPSYLVEDASSDLAIQYHVKDDPESTLFLTTDEFSYLADYDSHIMLETKSYHIAGVEALRHKLLAKKGGQVFELLSCELPISSEERVLYVSMSAPCDSKYNYDSDFGSILSSIVIPGDNEIRLTFSSDDLKGTDYEEVQLYLETMGFTNVQIENKHDLITGWITKNGSVEQVTINGSSTFFQGAWYPADSEIVITYHGKK